MDWWQPPARAKVKRRTTEIVIEQIVQEEWKIQEPEQDESFLSLKKEDCEKSAGSGSKISDWD